MKRPRLRARGRTAREPDRERYVPARPRPWFSRRAESSSPAADYRVDRRCRRAAGGTTSCAFGLDRHRSERMLVRPGDLRGEVHRMPMYMLQFAYTPEAWAGLVKSPENRAEAISAL